MKPIIQVDGTFLYGKYKGTLLIATSHDRDTTIVPHAFAIVDGETYEAWSWFLLNVWQHVVKDKQGLGLILDRHVAILAVMSNPHLG